MGDGVTKGRKGGAAKPVMVDKTRGNYVPVELRPFDARKGAMDAFKLPSLMGAERIYRKTAK